MRLAILGNSHAACLMNALTETPRLLGARVRPVFFAGVGKTMRDLRPEGRDLVPRTDILRQQIVQSARGADRLDVAAFDAFLLVGLGCHVPRLQAHLSAAVVARVVKRQMARAILWTLARDLRARSDAPILCMHTPLPSRAEDEAGLIPYDTLLPLIRAEIGDDSLTVMAQPAATRADDRLCTRQDFTKGSRRLVKDRPHGADDVIHMNAEYGALLLQAALARLDRAHGAVA